MNNTVSNISPRAFTLGLILALVIVSGPRMKYFPVYIFFTQNLGYNFKVGLLVSTVLILVVIGTLVLLKDDRKIRYIDYLLWPLFLFSAWFFIELLYGALKRNEITLFLGDFLKIILLVQVFIIVASLSGSETKESIRYFALFGSIGVILMFIMHMLGSGGEFSLWTILLIPAFLFSLDIVQKRFITNLILVSLLVVVVVGGMRTQWVALFVLMAFYLGLVLKKPTIKGNLKGYHIVFSILIMAILFVMVPNFSSHIYLEIKGLVTGGQSVSARIIEYQTVFEYMVTQINVEPPVLFHGFGLGAKYPVSPQLATIRNLTVENHHFIHSGFLAIFFRTGLIGIILFLIILFRTTRLSYQYLEQHIIVLWSMLLLLMTISVVSPFMVTLPYVIITGYVISGIHNIIRDKTEFSNKNPIEA